MFCAGSVLCEPGKSLRSYAYGTGATATGVAVDGSNLDCLTGFNVNGGRRGGYADGSNEESKSVHLEKSWMRVCEQK
jgi:hypothetical protein